MAIPFSCPGCQGSYQAEEIHAGKNTQCPKCKTVITIPAIQVETLDEFDTVPLADDPFAAGAAPAQPTMVSQPLPSPLPLQTAATIGKKLCPSCQAEMPGDAVLCVSCGYHLEKGRKVGRQSKPKPQPQQKQRRKRRRSLLNGIPEVWVNLGGAALGLGVLVVGGFFLLLMFPVGAQCYQADGSDVFCWGWGSPVLLTMGAGVLFCIGFALMQVPVDLLQRKGMGLVAIGFLIPVLFAPSFFFSHVTVTNEQLIVNDGKFWFWRDLHTINLDELEELQFIAQKDRKNRTVGKFVRYRLNNGKTGRIWLSTLVERALPSLRSQLGRRGFHFQRQGGGGYPGMHDYPRGFPGNRY